MSLVQTVYVSHALPELSQQDLRRILATSVRRNDEAGLTGFLLHGHGLFMQVLEGEPDEVAQTMQYIRADPRHDRIQELQTEPVSKREFGHWTMGFKDLDAEALQSEMFQPFLGRAVTLEQLNLRPHYALKLLRSLSEQR